MPALFILRPFLKAATQQDDGLEPSLGTKEADPVDVVNMPGGIGLLMIQRIQLFTQAQVQSDNGHIGQHVMQSFPQLMVVAGVKMNFDSFQIGQHAFYEQLQHFLLISLVAIAYLLDVTQVYKIIRGGHGI